MLPTPTSIPRACAVRPIASRGSPNEHASRSFLLLPFVAHAPPLRPGSALFRSLPVRLAVERELPLGPPVLLASPGQLFVQRDLILVLPARLQPLPAPH